MPKPVKYLLILLALGSSLILAAGIAFKIIFPPEKIRSFITETISKNLGREARIGDIRVGIFKGIQIRGFALSESPNFDQGTFMEIRAFVLKIALKPLLQKKIVVHEIILDAPQITVIQNADGKTFNFSDLLSDKPGKAEPQKSEPQAANVQPLSVTVTHAAIAGGKLNFIDKSVRKIQLVLDPINLNVNATELSKPMAIDLKVKAQGTFENKTIQADLGLKCVLNILAAYVKVENLTLNLPELDLEAQGKVEGFPKPELDFSLAIKNIDLKSLGRWMEIPKEVSIPMFPSIQASIKGSIENPKCSLNILGLSVKYGKISLEKVGAEIKTSTKEAEIVKLTGQIGAEGSEASDFEIKASVKDFARPNISLDVSIKTLDLGMFMSDSDKKEEPKSPPSTVKPEPYKGPVISSKGQIKIEQILCSKFSGRDTQAVWTLSGITPLLNQINGTANFEMKNGKIHKIPLLSALAPVLRTDPSALAFTRMSGSANISKGIAKTNDFKIESPVADIFAQGTLDLPTNSPDMLLTARLPKGSIGGTVGELANDALGRPTFVFKMKGGWKPTLDTSQVKKKVLEKAKEEIKTKAVEVLQNEGKKLLEGLFKR